MDRRQLAWVVVLAVLASVAAMVPSSALAGSKRVRTDYFGVDYPRVETDSPAMRNAQLQTIAAGGISQVRFTLSWVDVEPKAPVGGTHTYSYAISDQLVRAIAQHGLTSQLTLSNTPYWNNAQWTNGLNCLGWPSKSPADLDAYGQAIGALAKRYGPGGNFWSQNPGLPYRPIHVWEIWNEPNLKGQWCPGPEPDRYAKLFKSANDKIHAVDPHAEVVMGGMPLDSPSKPNLPPAAFIADVFRHEPTLQNKVDAIGVHVYPAGDISHGLDHVRAFRKQLQIAGVPNSTPMFMNELGWSRSGAGALTEKERKARYAVIPGEIARSNCNVDAIDIYAWTTPEANPSNIEDFYGIANPLGAYAYPSGRTYERKVAKMEGKKKGEAPHDLIRKCSHMPIPDRDGDGISDDHDYYPDNSSKWKGPGKWYHGLPKGRSRTKCVEWFEGSRAWRKGRVPHSTIVHLCQVKYFALKQTGKLKPLIARSKSRCQASAPSARSFRHEGTKRRNAAIRSCEDAAMRRAIQHSF